MVALEAQCDVECPPGGTLSPDALRTRIAKHDGLVCMLTDQIDRRLLDAAPRLRVVSTVAVGYNNIDVAAARARGIVVTHTPDVLTGATATLTWALILGITRRMGEGERLVRRGAWTGWAFDQLLGTEVHGRQLGIVGAGRIGRAVAAVAPAFGMSVAFAARDGREVPGGVSLPLERLLATSDVVSLHVPLTPETTHLIDQTALARMKRSAYLVNTSRGPVVDEAALVWALERGIIAGAALDVFEREPAVTPGLLALENVLVLPHLGSATVETRTAMSELAVRNVLAVLGGAPAPTPVP